MEALVREAGHESFARTRRLAIPILVWATWAALTAATVFFVQHYSRNIPYMDDFMLIPVMTGHEPISLRWLWSQHNEHRPVVSRLIMAGLFRFISPDFRLGLYFNAGLLSAAAASMLVLARKLRGRTRFTDVVLPLSILNIGQAETLLISFAMNLMLTAWISWELIRLASTREPRLDLWLTLKLGLFSVLLPLCGGSGLVMLPPILIWLACQSIWGHTGVQNVPASVRALGMGLLLVCLAVTAGYVLDYRMPPNHRSSPSLAAAAKTTVEYLSLVVSPNDSRYWRPAGLAVVVLVVATLARLALVGLRRADERPRALALAAVIVAMLIAAVAVGFSRSFMGPKFGLSSRYVTTSAPLLSVLYIAWLIFGPHRARRFVHGVLLTLVILAIPANIRFGVSLGEGRRMAYIGIERGLKAHLHVSMLVKKACPTLYPEPNVVLESFKMLKDAQVGSFKNLDDRVAAAPDAASAIR
jgi:hypothetical protein